MSDIASELESVARHLREAGQADLARYLTAAMRRAITPVRDEIRAGLRPHLPDRYADALEADMRLGVSIRSTGSDPGASVTAKTGKSRRLGRLNEGRLTHPLFGDREHWYTQPVQPGWFTGPCEAAAPRIAAELERALDDVSVKAAGKGA